MNLLDVVYNSKTSNKTKIVVGLLFVFLIICMCKTETNNIKSNKNLDKKSKSRTFLDNWVLNNPNKASHLVST